MKTVIFIVLGIIVLVIGLIWMDTIRDTKRVYSKEEKIAMLEMYKKMAELVERDWRQGYINREQYEHDLDIVRKKLAWYEKYVR